MASRSASVSVDGRPSESSASRGAAPIAARSLRLTASARKPIDAGSTKRRSKWTPSTRASVVSTSRWLRDGSTTAASSPMPTTTQDGAAGRRARIRAITACSPASPTVGDAGHRAYSTARVSRMTVTLIWPGYSSSFSMRRAMSFDSQTASSSLMRSLSTRMRTSRPGLQREGLRDALEGVGNAFELLEALHVGLEDVASGAGTRRRDGVGSLHEHRFERRPVDVHVVRGHGVDDRRALAVLAEHLDAELEVRAVEVAIDGLADVVKEGGAHGDVARRGRPRARGRRRGTPLPSSG